MARTAITAGLAGLALGFSLATAGLPPRAGAQLRLELTGDGQVAVYDGAAAERGTAAGGRGGGPARGGDGAAVLHTGTDPARNGRSAMPSGGGEGAPATDAEPAAPAAGGGRRG